MRLMQRCSGITGGTSERNELKRGKSKGLNKNLAYEHPFPADLKNTCQTGKKPAWGMSAKAALQSERFRDISNSKSVLSLLRTA